tara:strand:- start:404 stop:1354 length:951 start_codon:yes stop_codon:yes gene_type:complete
MEKNKKLRLLEIFFYVVIFFGLYFFLQNNKTLISFGIFQNSFVYYVILLKFLNFLVFNQLHLYIFKIYDLKMKKIENFELTFKGYIGNFFGFGKSGTGYKALILKNKHNFSYSKFLSFFVLLQTLTLFSTAFICFIIIIFSTNLEHTNKTNLIILLLFVMVISIFANYSFRILSKIKIFNKIKPLKTLITGLEQTSLNIRILKITNKEILRILFFQVCIQINLFFQIYLQASIINIDMSLLNNFVYNIISQVSIFLSITPNSIGIKEFFLVISNDFIGLSSIEVFDLAIIDRITDSLSLLLFVVFYYLVKKIFIKS